ncbi:MAG: hypothetical protein IPI32_03520 [Austwickia sp.]|nr:hypothetical protein [Austwickia sp.]MBK8436703.1 hypothetical protein [Austwickia sp.]MBK9100333.1 hypothetical protein [Austwickia sp.]
MSVSAFDPLVIHHVSPAAIMAIGAGVISAASVATGVIGHWFTRMERQARAEGLAEVGADRRLPLSDSLPGEVALGPGGLAPPG